MKIGIGIDTGGTCTDAVAYDMDTKTLLAKGKALTTHSCLQTGIAAALDTLPQEYIREAELVSLSTTLATNACLEGKGSRCRLVMIGMTDELVRRFKIDKNYGIPLDKVTCIDNHSSADGLYIDMPDWDSVIAEYGDTLRDADVLACSELYSSNNGAPCEKEFKIVAGEKLGVRAVCAHELTSELNVIARGATAMLNARLLPVINDFISAILSDLERRGCKGRVTVVRSDGSRMNAAATLDKPVETILSGPAASVLAGQAFYDGSNYITVDMGGTTTDVSVVVGAQPVPARGGIRLGPWRTTVQGIFASPFTLGGDTQIWISEKTDTSHNRGAYLWLGVRRVKSLCSAAVVWPEIKDMLRRMVNTRDKHLNLFPLHEILYLLHEPARPELYSQDEQTLIEALRSGPVMLEDLKEKLGLDLYHFTSERLESEGIVMRCGLTPTDFMHIKGDYNEYDREASVLGARYLLAALHRSDSEEELMKLCDEVYDAVEERMYCNLVHIMLRQRYPNRFEGEPQEQLAFVIRQSWRERNKARSPYIHQLFGTDMALVGVGAPIHVFLPEVAKALGTECILPEHHDVANALGALQAQINATVRIEITQMQQGDGTPYYVAHLPNGSRRYDNAAAAIKDAKAAAAQKAIDEARARGARGELNPTVRAGRAAAKDLHTGEEILMGAVVEAVVTER